MTAVPGPVPAPPPVVGNLNLDDPSEPFTRRSWRYRTRMIMRTARERIGDDPALLPIVLRATPLGTARQLTDQTSLVIEGFPRSGNTFAYFAVCHAANEENRSLEVSSHVHTPSAVKAATARRIPTVVVIRRPLDAVTSLLIAAPHVPFDRAILEWSHHHQEIWPYRDRFLTATFQQVTTDMGSVTQRLGRLFGTHLPQYQPSEVNDAEVFASIEQNHQVLHGGTENVVPRPSSARQAERIWLEDQLKAPHLARLLHDANLIFGRYSSHSLSR